MKPALLKKSAIKCLLGPTSWSFLAFCKKVSYSSFPAPQGSVNEKSPFQGIIKKSCRSIRIEMNVWQSNLMVSLVGTDLGVVLGKSNNWHYNLQIGQEHQGKFSSQFDHYSPTATTADSLWAMERRILAPAFSPHIEVVPFLPFPLPQHQYHTSAAFLVRAVMVTQIMRY